MKLFLTNIFMLFHFISIAQVDTNKGINFQAIARNADGSIVPSKDISIRLSIREGSASGTIEYQEIKTTSTNVVGLFSVVLGSNSNSNITVIGDYNNINWQTGNKYLQVEIDPFNSINFILLGVQKINYVPYALVANSIDWANVKGLDTELNKKLSIQDTATMLKPYFKSGDFVKESKLNGIDSFNINLNGSLTTSKKLIVGENIEALGKSSTIGTKENPFKGLFLSSGSLSIASDTLNKNIPAAVLSNVAGNLQISAGGIKLMGSNSSLIAPRIIGTLNGNASSASKLDSARKINGVEFDGSSDITIPILSNKDQKIELTGDVTGSGTGTFTATLKNTGVTADDYGSSSVIPVLTIDAKGRITNATNSNIEVNAGSLTGTTINSNITNSSLKTVGTITSGTWSGSIIGSNVGGAGVVNGMMKANGSGVVSAAVAGTDYVVPNSAITSLSGSNTGDQTISLTGDVTGSGTGTFTATLNNTGVTAASYGTSTTIPVLTIDTKGRVTSATNSNIEVNAGSLTGTTINSNITNSSITSVGTITNGTWSATTIDIAHGGTGTNTLNGILLGTNGSGATAIRTAAYGSFYDLTNQTVSATNSPTAMSYNTTDFAEGVSIESNGSKLTRIKVANRGKYNIQFSAQIGRSTGNSTETISIWLRKNGVDVPASCTEVVIHGAAALADLVAAWNFFQSLNANDYIEIMWSSTDTNLLINWTAATTSPLVKPSIPSVILTVQQVY